MILLLLAAAVVQNLPPAVVNVPEFRPRAELGETLVTWQVSEMLCGGERVAPVMPVQPYASAALGPIEQRLAFRIDADGRPLGIEGGTEYGAATDLAPALAATRFAAGERRDCTVTWRATRMPVAEAPVADVMAYTIFPSGPPSKAMWDRVRPVGTTCSEPPPRLRSRAYPDFEAIAQAPGTTSWSMVGYDLNAAGRPVRVRTLEGSGNAALDRASLRAVSETRFWNGGRTGCLYPYYRRGPILVAPGAPEPASVRPNGATCPAETGWDRKPVLRYPERYRRRSIEGWALIAYDVAPWGQTGNVRVLSAEPAAAFGDYAKRVIESASKPKSTAGYIGCVERVRFAMGGGEQARLAEAPPPSF